jgi:WD40 repeat protein
MDLADRPWPGTAKIVVWDVERRVRLGALPVGEQSVSLGALAPEGRTLALVQQRRVSLWDVASRMRLAILPGQADDASLAFSPDGSRLAMATSSPPGRIVLSDVADPPKAAPLATDGYWERPVFSPDGRWLAVHGVGGIELWDLGERRRVATLPGQGRAVFSPDSRFLAASAGLAVAGPPQEVAIWDLGTRERVASLGAAGEEGGEALGFSPDSQMLATIGEDGVAPAAL